MLTIDALQAQIPATDGFRRAPTDRWQPTVCGDIDIRIDALGQWFHEGTLIQRHGLVRLLASVLVREDDGYWLKTPVEKLRIDVADAPFVVQDLLPNQPKNGATGTLSLRTNVGEDLTLSSPWSLAPSAEGEPLPLIQVTPTLSARLSRNLYYHLCHETLAQLPRPDADGVVYWQAVGQHWPLGNS